MPLNIYSKPNPLINLEKTGSFLPPTKNIGIYYYCSIRSIRFALENIYVNLRPIMRHMEYQSVVANGLNCNVIAIGFELQLRHSVHFRTSSSVWRLTGLGVLCEQWVKKMINRLCYHLTDYVIIFGVRIFSPSFLKPPHSFKCFCLHLVYCRSFSS